MAFAGELCAAPGLMRWRRRRTRGGWLGVLGLNLLAQAAAVAACDSLDSVGKVVQQVPAVGHLDRVRGPESAAFGVAAGAVAADDPARAISCRPLGLRLDLGVGVAEVGRGKAAVDRVDVELDEVDQLV